MAIYNVLVPECLKDFRCVGSECELTCCQGWRIDVDELTLKKYKNCKDSCWQKEFAKNLVPREDDKSKYILNLNENKMCNFLDKDGLCMVQKRFGENYLGRVCRSYPRTYNKIGKEIFEQTYEMSCPEVIKKLLLEKEALTFVKIKQKFDKLNTIFFEELNQENPQIKNFSQLRTFTLNVLQNRNYSLLERMLILTYFFNNFRGQNLDQATVAETINLFEKIIQDGSVTAVLREIKGDRTYFYNFLQQIVREVFTSAPDLIFKKYCEDFFAKLHLDKVYNDRYFYYYDTYYKLFSLRYPFVLENYLVASVYSFRFPCNYANIWDNWLELVIRWSLINFFFMGMMKNESIDIKELDFLRCFAVFSRVIDSAVKPKPLTKLVDYLKSENQDDIAHTFKMIKV